MCGVTCEVLGALAHGAEGLAWDLPLPEKEQGR